MACKVEICWLRCVLVWLPDHDELCLRMMAEATVFFGQLRSHCKYKRSHARPGGSH